MKPIRGQRGNLHHWLEIGGYYFPLDGVMDEFKVYRGTFHKGTVENL